MLWDKIPVIQFARIPILFESDTIMKITKIERLSGEFPIYRDIHSF